jgi:sulfatase maturation enzyme AslB (radical SAM superfamily)
MLKFENIKNVHLELSTNCNASCPLCSRNFHGYPYNGGFEIIELKLNDIKKIFSPEFCLQLRFIDICGNFGDFLLASESIEILDYFNQCNKNLLINIHTNGSARNGKFWSKLAEYNSYVLFDIDGLSDTHSLYRRGTNWDIIIRNAKTYIAAGGRAIWKMIPFDYNEHQIEECRKLSQNLGFKDFILFDQKRNKGPVYNKQGDYIYNLDKDNWLKFNNVKEHLNWYEKWFDTKRYVLNPDDEISCESKNKQSIYISAAGEVYPCCQLGHNPRTYKDVVGNHQIKEMLEDNNVNNNALQNDLRNCIEWFNMVEQSWSLKSFEEGKLYICSQTCGKCKSDVS